MRATVYESSNFSLITLYSGAPNMTQVMSGSESRTSKASSCLYMQYVITILKTKTILTLMLQLIYDHRPVAVT